MRLADLTARVCITLGGLGTILAVSTVFLYLLWEVLPLFLPGHLAENGAVRAPAAAPRILVPGEYRELAWLVTDEGRLEELRLEDGSIVREQRLGDRETPPTVVARSGEDLLLGFPDGSVQLGSVRFATSFDEEDPGTRQRRLEVSWEEPVALSPGHAILAADVSRQAGGEVLAALSDDGVLRLRSVRRTKNLLTGEVKLTLRGGEVALPEDCRGQPPLRLLIAGLGDNVFLVWRDGRLLRYDCRKLAAPVLTERVGLLEGTEAQEVTALAFLAGKTSLAVGDDRGGVRVWFRIKPEGAATGDGAVLVAGHTLAPGAAPVTALAASIRRRLLAAGHADGRVRLHYVTSERLVGETAVEGGEAVRTLAITPKDDAIYAVAGGRLHAVAVDAPHPEVTLGAIFGKVWYEGYVEPAHVWQSSSGTDDFEPKYGLMPLVFGTFKATFYALLFAVPLALLAAVYTSEFLHPRLRARVKPAIEVMASLPSVVLGFLAALVVAPWVEGRVPELLACCATVPWAFLLGAHLWQLLPGSRGGRLARLRLPALFLAVPVGVLLGLAAGPALETAFFGGDIMAWLDGQVGDGRGGLLFVTLPASAFAVAFLFGRFVNPWLRRRGSAWQRPQAARMALWRFLLGSVGALLLAVVLARGLADLGVDPRGAWLGTYVQRNAAVVGFIMGFAVIPIIYTIAEDALSAVPEHLRAASLGAGATRWQTAMRIVVPTAMSGIFSALMVGLGRAVGETMIVLMAAGNTPVMDWNIFNGLRTLSANIAVELPEAVQGSTHYRMLFLAALVLFVLTFLLNTVAELVRNRFRRRAGQL